MTSLLGSKKKKKKRHRDNSLVKLQSFHFTTSSHLDWTPSDNKKTAPDESRSVHFGVFLILILIFFLPAPLRAPNRARRMTSASLSSSDWLIRQRWQPRGRKRLIRCSTAAKHVIATRGRHIAEIPQGRVQQRNKRKHSLLRGCSSRVMITSRAACTVGVCCSQ